MFTLCNVYNACNVYTSESRSPSLPLQAGAPVFVYIEGVQGSRIPAEEPMTLHFVGGFMWE